MILAILIRLAALIHADHAEVIGCDLAQAGAFPFGFPNRQLNHWELYRRIAGDILALGE